MTKSLAEGLFLAAFLVATLPASAPAASYQPLVGVAHVHSTASTGILSLEEIALQAETSGIEVVLLAENYHLQFAYNLLPLPGLLQASKRFPSLTQSTIAEYLQAVEETNRRHPKVLLIPGVETVPHYYWTGSLLGGDLTMHNGQKNILITGFDKPEDYQGLPLVGNSRGGQYNTMSLIRAAPLLLVVAGFGLLARKRERRYQIGGFMVSQRRRPWRLAVPLILIGGAWSAYNAPFTVPAFPPDHSDAGTAPYQALIDYVDRRGGMTIWSYLEAKDFHVHTYTLTRRLVTKFTTKTDPYPEVLLATDRFTAFGATYQDNTTAERPGQMWDRALEQYCLGRRSRPPWGLGELGFHGNDRKRLADVLTTFYVRERTAKGVLEALSAGRMDAAIPAGDIRIRVRTFSLSDGRREAVQGETMVVPPGGTVTLRLALEAHGGTARPFRATLVRNGKPWRDLEATTPFTITLEDTLPPGRACTYYRFWMHPRAPHRLITNPIFAATTRKPAD
ncbi:hypothetical protein MYX64_04830 [Nitrospinae bacterium AH_259_B05_G02_I21]|nr:hypothetical protein [Nitrospinae bacterium AH_259_B05_G02_I21]